MCVSGGGGGSWEKGPHESHCLSELPEVLSSFTSFWFVVPCFPEEQQWEIHISLWPAKSCLCFTSIITEGQPYASDMAIIAHSLFFLPWEMYNYWLFHVELGRMTCLPNKMWVQVETLEGIAKGLAHSLQFLLREPLPWEAPTDGVDLSPTADWDQKPNSWPTDTLGWKTHAWLLSKALECKGSYLLHGLSTVLYPNWHKFGARFYLQMKKFNCRGMY